MESGSIWIKRIFGNNWGQSLFIIACFALTLIGKNLSVVTIHLGVSNFIHEAFHNVTADKPSFDPLTNVAVPMILYFFAFLLFLAMISANVLILKEEKRNGEGSRTNKILRVSLIILELCCSVISLFLFGKLFIYSLALMLMILFVAAIVIFIFTQDSNNKKSSY